MTSKPKSGVVTEIAVKVLKPDPLQPRQHYNEALLKAFADNLKANGIIQPITIRWDGGPIIVHGERRWRAAKIAGLKTVPCVMAAAGEDVLSRGVRQIAENDHRESLKPLDLAEYLDGLRVSQKKTHNELVKALQERGFTEAGHMKVRQLLDLVLLPDWTKKLLRDGKISETSAHVVVSVIKEPDVMAAVKESIEQAIKWRDECTAAEVKRFISSERYEIKRAAEEAERNQKELLRAQKAKDDEKAGKGSKPTKAELRQQEHRQERVKELKGEKLEVYLDTWLRQRMVSIVATSLPLGRLQALALWMATGAPQGKPEKHSDIYWSRETREGDACRNTQAFMTDWKLGNITTFLDLDVVIELPMWQDMARAAVLTTTQEQLRSLAHWMQINLLAIGYQLDMDYLNLLRKDDILKLAKIAKIEDASGTLRQVKDKILETAERIALIGVPADLEKVYRKAPKARTTPEIDLEAALLKSPTATEAAELAGGLTPASVKGKTTRGKAR